MRNLLGDCVLPKLAAWASGSRLKTRQRIYKIFGLSESEVNSLVASLELPPDIIVGYYPVFPDVHLSILVRSTETTDTGELFRDGCGKIEQTLGSGIYGTDHDELEAVIGLMLTQRGLHLSVAESCSGGLLSHRMTSVPGSSAYFNGGAITYSNELKQRLLGVDPDLLIDYGAVSAEVAEAMARGVQAHSRSDVALAITGIAGPDGGTEEKPVGTVFICLAYRNDLLTTRHRFSGDRSRIQTLSVHTALNTLRLYLLEQDVTGKD